MAIYLSQKPFFLVWQVQILNCPTVLSANETRGFIKYKNDKGMAERESAACDEGYIHIL